MQLERLDPPMSPPIETLTGVAALLAVTVILL